MFEFHHWSPVQAMERVKHALSAPANTYHSDAFLSLEKPWAKLHTTLDHSAKEVFTTNPGRRQSMCQKAGMCVCVCAPNAGKS